MSARDYLRSAIASGIDGPHTESLLDAFIAEVLNEAANGLAALGLVDSLVSGPQAWTEAIETLRRMAAAGQAPAPTNWIDGHPQLEAIAAAVWERREHHGSGLIVDDPRNIAVAALGAGQAPAPYDHGTGGSPCADCGHDWFMHRHEDGTCRVCSCERYDRPAPAPQAVEWHEGIKRYVLADPEPQSETTEELLDRDIFGAGRVISDEFYGGTVTPEDYPTPRPRRLDDDGRCRHCRRTPEQCDATGCGGRHDPYSAPWSNPKPETAS